MCELSNDRAFTKRIRVVHVDEAHQVWDSGVKKHGQPAFRPSYGTLDVWRVNLLPTTCFQLLSATLPPHILKIVKEKTLISADHKLIKLSSNRANIVYATLPIRGRGMRDFNNLNFIIPNELSDVSLIQKTIVFFDSLDLVIGALDHLCSRLGPTLRHQPKEVIKLYHSQMSVPYLQAVYNDFADPNGTCKIFLTTSVASLVSLLPLSYNCCLTIYRVSITGM